MKRHWANIVTSLRIVFSGAMLLCPLFSVWFYISYAICGISDMVDGTIARRTNSATEFGARLDTIADTIFAVIVIIKIAPILDHSIWLWVAVIATIKLINIAIGYIRYHRFVSLHTVLNKVTGAILFITPFTLLFIDQQYLLYTICPIALLSSLHECYLIIKGRTIIPYAGGKRDSTNNSPPPNLRSEGIRFDSDTKKWRRLLTRRICD